MILNVVSGMRVGMRSIQRVKASNCTRGRETSKQVREEGRMYEAQSGISQRCPSGPMAPVITRASGSSQWPRNML